MKLMNFTKRAAQAGFTMIELLIVIAILGILAVAVLAAINPLEQINRGRDTASLSDAEQLIGAMDRYAAFRGFLPYQMGINDPMVVGAVTGFVPVDENWLADNTVTAAAAACKVLEVLGTTPLGPSDPICTNTDELKSSFMSKITDDNYNQLLAFNRGAAGDNHYVCFEPRSQAFRATALERCGETAATSILPADLVGAWALLCGGTDPIHCLP